MNRLLVALPLILTGCIIQLPPEDRAAAPRARRVVVESPPPVVAPPPPVIEAPPPPAPVAAPTPAPVIVATPVEVEYPPLRESEIAGAYEDLLGRRPTQQEMFEWRERSRHVRSSDDDVRNAVRSSPEFQNLVPEAVVFHAYRDYLGRAPEHDEMRYFRRRFIDDDWTIGQVRREVSRHGDRNRRGENRDHRGDRDREGRYWRLSDEHEAHSFNVIIERAYDDLLEREPDPEGQNRYRQLLERGESEKRIRERIKQGLEYRVTLPDSKTKRAYLAVLGREADPVGLEGYRHRIVDDHWSEQDVENSLRQTAEYRNKHK